jgi:MerR family transcriptional regulator, light-induced transcriptional regulator
MNLLPEAPSTNVSREPLYNIGVVTRMTGISMATLRAWERRYNFPEASRTTGGHRLYSERDIMRLRWVKSRIGEGMQTAQAIQALRHQELTGQDISTTAPEVPAVDRIEIQSSAVSGLYQDQLTTALIERNIQKADQILGEALAISSPDELILNVIGPTMAAIGDSWEKEQISVATEHLVTNYLRQRLLMWMVSGPPPQATQPVVLACAPNEWHEGSLLMLGALLRRQRWPVAYLGQAVPLPDLASLVNEIRPTAVVLVAMAESTAAALLEWPKWMPGASTSGKPIICFGGRIFSTQPEWQVRMPGIYLGNTLQEGNQTLNKLLNGLI